MKILTVNGIDECKKAIADAEGRIFVLFTGSLVNGKSWCPDCVVADPVIESVIHSKDASELNATFIKCFVGQRDYWKDPACPFRTDPAFKINCVPTLLEYGKKHKRLGDSQAANENLLKELFFED